MTVQQIPDRLGPYRLLETIGSGGMGVVRLARDSRGRAVAVKLLHPWVAGDPDARRRLSREVTIMRRVRSPFVAEIIDAEITGDFPYVVTRYVAGLSLDQLVERDGPLRGRALDRVAWGLAEGLAAVHAAGVVHRDLKPGNVVIAGGVPVLIDFGIAHAPDATKITQAGMFLGTPGYLAPEVVEGQPSGQPADVHSWASTVAFAATGRPPFGTGAYETIFYRIVNGKADLDGVPARLMPLITAAHARNPAVRPSSAELSMQCAAIDLSAPQVPAPAASAPEPAVVSPADLVGALPPAAEFPEPEGRPAHAEPRHARAEPEPVPSPAQAESWPARSDPGPAPAQPGPGPSPAQAEPWLARAEPGPVPSPAQAEPWPAHAEPGPGPPAAAQAPARPQPPPAIQAPVRQRVPVLLRRLFGLAVMILAVAGSVLLPIAGSIAALSMIAALRATEEARTRLARRRAAGGRRFTDVPLVLAWAPWALVRALLGMVRLAPLALLCGAAATAAAFVAGGPDRSTAAWAYAAGAVVACYGLGPRSRIPRGQLGRLLGTIARGRVSAGVTTLLAVLVAAEAVAVALSQPHDLWPLSGVPSLHLPGLGHIAVGLAARLHGF